MDRTQFVDVSGHGWWLLEPDLDSGVEEKRVALGAAWGGSGDTGWYTDAQKLDEIFQFLEANRSDLLSELDADQDSYARQKWVDDLIGAKEAATPAAAQVASGTEEQVAAPAGGSGGESAQPEASTAVPEQPKKPGLFARKPAPVSEPEVEKPAAVDEAQLEVINEQVQHVMEEMSDDQLAALAKDTGLSVDQVKEIVSDPSFASAVAAAQ
jgi:hypothetical protein